jgi:hypothetical protein
MRPLGDIDALVGSIRGQGLLTPITVTRERRLVSGLRQLVRCSRLCDAVRFPPSCLPSVGMKRDYVKSMRICPE